MDGLVPISDEDLHRFEATFFINRKPYNAGLSGIEVRRRLPAGALPGSLGQLSLPSLSVR